VYTAYFDASGTTDSSVLTMAGYVSDEKKWGKFDKHWREILDRQGIQCFHMTDCVSCHGEFEDWRDKGQIRKRFINDLADCARRFTNKRFSATVVIDDYKKVDAEFQLHESLGSPYSLCGSSCVEHVKTWARNQKVDTKNITYLFEGGDAQKGDFCDLCRQRFGFTPNFESKRTQLRFQAADLAAWRTRHPIREAVGTRAYTEAKFESLLFHTSRFLSEPHAGGGFDEPALLKICAGAPIPRRTRQTS
jgi:hypothetical protein